LLLGAIYLWWRFPMYGTSGVGMSPSIDPGDLFVVDRLAYNATHGPTTGDVIAFTGPTFSSVPGAPMTPGVKRVAAVPGDQITIQGGTLYRNGQAVREPSLGSRPPYRFEIRDFAIFVNGRRPAGVVMPVASRWRSPDRVPAGCYVVLGDNRANSVDSHIVGFLCPGLPTTIDGVVPSILGRVIMPPFWPPRIPRAQ
jgi:signal peptidase I